MKPNWLLIDLRHSEDAKSLQVRPCRIDGDEGDDEAVITCAPAEATFWGVYYSGPIWVNSPGETYIALADFDTEKEAIAFAFYIAKGRAVYAYDTLNGERLA